jgi:hypothetical protein
MPLLLGCKCLQHLILACFLFVLTFTVSPELALANPQAEWPYHAVLSMAIGCIVIVLLTGMFIARYMKQREWWLEVDKTMGIVGGLNYFIWTSIQYTIRTYTARHSMKND